MLLVWFVGGKKVRCLDVGKKVSVTGCVLRVMFCVLLCDVCEKPVMRQTKHITHVLPEHSTMLSCLLEASSCVLCS